MKRQSSRAILSRKYRMLGPLNKGKVRPLRFQKYAVHEVFFSKQKISQLNFNFESKQVRSNTNRVQKMQHIIISYFFFAN